MTFSKSQAKTLLTKEELTLFEAASGSRLKKWTVVELKDFTSRSRAAKDKSRGQAMRQRRLAQVGSGYRQTDAGARTDQKAQLLKEIHSVFADRLAAVETGEVSVAAGKKAKVIPRPERKVINRVQRAVVRDQVAQTQADMVVAQRMARKRNTGTVAAAKPATTGMRAAKAVKVSAVDVKVGSTAGKRTAAKPKQPATPAKSGKAAKPPVAKKSVAAALAVKKTRAKAQAKRAARTSAGPVMPEKSSKAPVRRPDSEGLSRAQAAANRTLGAKASKTRVAVGGSARIKSHVAAANRRQQSRRDSR
jgi:hypothetical protein